MSVSRCQELLGSELRSVIRNHIFWRSVRRKQFSVIVLTAVVLFISKTSSHFEWLSVTTRNIFPFFSAKSTSTLYHERVARSHGMRGAEVGAFLCLVHSGQLRTISSMSLSIPGHYTKFRTMAFILAIPGCMARNS